LIEHALEPQDIWFNFYERQKLYQRGVEKIVRYNVEIAY
jgi:hypothetical protein